MRDLIFCEFSNWLRKEQSWDPNSALFQGCSWKQSLLLCVKEKCSEKRPSVLLKEVPWFGRQCLQLSEKAMAPHSSTLAWKIPWAEEPGRLQSMGSLRVGHDRVTSLFTFLHWRRKWQPTPVFLPWRISGTWEPGGLSVYGVAQSTIGSHGLQLYNV